MVSVAVHDKTSDFVYSMIVVVSLSVGICVRSLFCCVVIGVLSSFIVIMFLRKSELVTLL